MKDEVKKGGAFDVSSLVRKINELFHLQEDKEWEKKSIQLAQLYGKLNYYEGQRTALQNLIGRIDADTDDLLSGKLEKIEQLILSVHDCLEQEDGDIDAEIMYKQIKSISPYCNICGYRKYLKGNGSIEPLCTC